MVTRQRLPLILLLALIAGVATYIILVRLYPLLYETHFTVVPYGRYPIDPKELLHQIIDRDETLREIAQNIHLTLSPDELRQLITITNIKDTTLAVVTITYTDPTSVLDLANRIAERYDAAARKLSSEEIALVDSVIRRVYHEIDMTSLQLQQTQVQLTSATDNPLLPQLTQTERVYDERLQSLYSGLQFLNDAKQNGWNRSALPVVEAARLPTSPLNSYYYWAIPLLAAITASVIVLMTTKANHETHRSQPLQL
jgi:hypothetical protein